MLAAASCLQAAENSYITLDTVYKFTPGTGQDFGQDSMFFPKNIFGKPFENADSIAPNSSPYDLLSLGLGGEIIVGFKDYKITDKPGIDFIVYENVMKNQITEKYFVEPAEISVSNDGINFIPFPFDTATLKGAAGITPTLGKMVDIDVLKSGGDGFDIADLGLKEVKYIKIKDVTKIIMNPNHRYYDKTLSGFDLDAVLAVHFEKITNAICEKSANIKTIIEDNSYADVSVYNLLGEQIIKDKCINYFERMKSVASGVYILVINIDNKIAHFKINI